MLQKDSAGMISIVLLLAILGLAGCQFDGQNDKVMEVSVTETKMENCLNLRTGTVNVKLIYPDFLKQSWYRDPVTLENLNTMRLWKIVEPNITGGKPIRKNVLIIDDRYYEPVKAIIDASKVEPGPKYEESDFNGFPAAHNKYVSDTEGLWEYYLIPFGNRVIRISYHPSVLTDDELKQAEEMLNGMIFTEVTADIKGGTLNYCTNETIVPNRFTSRDHRLIFSHREDWVCREVVYGKRVDCYPKEREPEEYDAGLDEPIVYYPNIGISIEDCAAKGIPADENPEMELYFYIKNYNGCRVLVLAEDGETNTEEKLNAIIYP